MGLLGYITGSAYLILSIIALGTIKGIGWAVGATVTGVIAFFPIWAYFMFDYSSTLIWILFFITIIDAVIESNKK